MSDFKIKRGLSTTMFTSSGVVNPRLVIEEGYWYLCTDTAELFLGVKLNAGTEEELITLKRINSTATPSVDPVPDEDINNLKFIVEELSNKVAVLEDIELFQKIHSEADLPTNFDSEDFNPNITYYIYQPEAGTFESYIYDKDTQSYLCTTKVGATGLGIANVEINANGELVVRYTDGTQDTVGNVIGADGLTTAIKVGNKLYTHTNGVIELPEFATLEYVEAKFRELVIPKEITKLSELENDVGFLTEHQDLSDYAKKSELPSTEGLATEAFVKSAIAQAELSGSDVDLSDYVTKDLLDDYATKDFVGEAFSDSLNSVILHGGDATPEE